MNFEPQKFFIGLMDFFSILMPGALLTYMIKNDIGSFFIGENAYSKIGEGEAWAIFLFISYLLGHFIFLIGSTFLDHYVYSKIRNATYYKQIDRLAESDTLSPKYHRWLAMNFFDKYVDLSLNMVLRIKSHYLDPMSAKSSINAFQWSKAQLLLEKPEVMVTVQRFEADSKFFRSLFVVLFLLILWNLGMQRWWIALVGVPLLVPSISRYIDQRAKSTRQAYWNIITMEVNKGKGGFRQEEITQNNGMTHAGGVVFKKGKNGKDLYLLVQSKNTLNEWVLPKGQIKSEESIKETAVREIREETGVWARIKDKCSYVDKEFKVPMECKEKKIKIRVRFYLMEFLEEIHSKKQRKREKIEDRKMKWMTLDNAIKSATHKETIKVLKKNSN